MTKTPTSKIPPDAPDSTRRKLLATLTFSMPAAWLAGSTLLARSAHATVTPAATGSVPASFMTVSRLLTGHDDIDDALSDLAWAALSTRTADFATRFATLDAAINKSGLKKLADYPQSPIAQAPALKTTAVDIVSAWYLGRVGAIKERAADGPTPITYTGALMWRPTIDVTVIPTYSRGKPGFWVEKPPSTDTD